MSLNYAAALSKYPDKGVLGLKENFEDVEKVNEKCKLLATWIKASNKIVFMTGAGVSTSVGIPDFRGPNGVWTLEEKGKTPDVNIDFLTAAPSPTHHAIKSIFDSGKQCYVVSQNVDNLHLKSGFPKENLSELHGNIFTERCLTCGREFLRATATKTIGMKKTGNMCLAEKPNGRKCRGKLVDTVLDWEDSLPWDELIESEYQCSIADLCVVVGTTLQIQPAGNMPFKTRRAGGRVVMINLQRTRMDQHSDLVIHGRCDTVFVLLMQELGVQIQDRTVPAPPAGQLRMIKDSFRPTPPVIPKRYHGNTKHRVKRVKVHKNGAVTKTDITGEPTGGAEENGAVVKTEPEVNNDCKASVNGNSEHSRSCPESETTPVFDPDTVLYTSRVKQQSETPEAASGYSVKHEDVK